MTDKIPGWHFIRDDRTTGEGNLKVEVGQTLTVEGELKLCKHGLHAYRKPLDALEYAPGLVACKVEVWGDVVEHDDKLCGRNRKCLAMVDATNILHEFACRCAQRALLAVGRESDPRSWAAIEAKRKWLRGEIDDKQLAMARARAWARAMAWAAARDAAWAAARDAAWDAAWAAEREWQNAELTRMLEEGMGEKKGEKHG